MTSTLAPTIPLRNGPEMPVLGLGTWPLRGTECATAVRTAIGAGYRLIDTAENYQNEDGVRQGVRESGIDRAELFLTTKLNRRWHGVDGVRQACEASCERLGVDYLDLMLIHWPNPQQDRYVEAVLGLQQLLGQGRLRAIGVSNFKPAHLQRVIDETGVLVDVNQIQLSPYTTRDEARALHAKHGIVTESWGALGGEDDDLRSDSLITEIAERHQRSTSQTVLRWHHQLGLVTVPKSANPGRIAENLDIFDFSLTDDEMSAISSLDYGEAHATDSDSFGH